MSAPTTPSDSPLSIQPLHNPAQAAHIVVPHAPLGNATNNAVGQGAKALLAKRMAKAKRVYEPNPKFVSPTDNLLTPVTLKLNAAKQKRFAKGVEPMGKLGGSKDGSSSDEGIESDTESKALSEAAKAPEAKTTLCKPRDEDDNPF